MNQRTWPEPAAVKQFSSLPLSKAVTSSCQKQRKNNDRDFRAYKFFKVRTRQSSQIRPSPSLNLPSPSYNHDFSALPWDVLRRIAAAFTLPSVQTASLVCKSWCEALKPLREAMLFLKWGKQFKHGKNGVKPNLSKALDSFLKGAARGSTLAMVDAGLMYWEMGKKMEGTALYLKAAELGDPTGQCNLGISYLQGEPSNKREAVRWLYQASIAGHVRAKYQLALCLHQGCGVNYNLHKAARWYLDAAKGGYVRAMYNVSLCYFYGEGLTKNYQQSRKWMKHAADHGHAKAQFEHGLALFAEGEMMKAAVYLELATRAGETAASHVKNVILEQLRSASRDHVMHLADNWRALPSSY